MHRKAHNLRFSDPYRRPGDWCGFWKSEHVCFDMMGELDIRAGAGPGFFLGGVALASCSTSTPINHTVFYFFAEYQLY